MAQIYVTCAHENHLREQNQRWALDCISGRSLQFVPLASLVYQRGKIVQAFGQCLLFHKNNTSYRHGMLYSNALCRRARTPEISPHHIFRDGKKYYSYEIRGTVQTPGQFFLSDKQETLKGQTGATVQICNPEPTVGSVLSNDFREHMSRIFAPYLLNYREIKLTIDGAGINTSEIVAKREEFTLDPVRLNDGTLIPAVLEVGEWESINGRALYLCDEKCFRLSERSPDVRAPGFNFGAYLKSQYFSQLDEGALVDLDLAEGMGHLLNAARSRLGVYFKQREREKAKALIAAWKAEGVYPYPDVPQSRTAEKAN